MTQAAQRRLPAASRPLTPGELKLLRIAGRRAALNYLAERNAAKQTRREP